MAESPPSMIGRYVGRGLGAVVLLGKVVSFDGSAGMFTVSYEDGRAERLCRAELGRALLPDARLSRPDLAPRKRNLDSLPTTVEREKSRRRVDPASASASTSACPCDVEEDPLVLPPSSSKLEEFEGVPAELVPRLLLVYSLLRLWSVKLFLSPFAIEDLVECVNRKARNSLLDSVHLSLMRAVGRRLRLASAKSELASECLRLYDWSLLDALTWPAILFGYLYIMGYMKRLCGKGFSFGVSADEYYMLPAAVKLEVLQILCDFVVDSAELRKELDIPESPKEEDEYRASSIMLPKSAPRIVNSVESKLPNLNSEASEAGIKESGSSQDGNSSNCLLCGMSGVLISCGWCLSTYHSRCIGLSRDVQMNGPWSCPECKFSKLGMASSSTGRGMCRVEIFGADAIGRIFLGTCNHLLVVGKSFKLDSFCRCYNRDDVTKVLNAIDLTTKDASIYAEIFRRISKCLEVPFVTTQSIRNEPILDPRVNKQADVSYRSSSVIMLKRTANGFDVLDMRKCLTDFSEGRPDNRAVICQRDCSTDAKENCSIVELMDKAEFPDLVKQEITSHNMYTNVVPEVVKEREFTSGNAILNVQKLSSVTQTEIGEQQGNKSLVTSKSCYSKQPTSADKLILLDAATYGSGNEKVMPKEDAGSSTSSRKNRSVSTPIESRTGLHNDNEKYRNESYRTSNKPSIDKPQTYINQYIQGEIAASAAANLAFLVSEKNNVLEPHVSSDPWEILAANTALQMKAFSKATSNLLWPSLGKQVIEISRERCGWCIACNFPAACKKQCLLDLAVSDSIKWFARSFNGLLPSKHIESYLPLIATKIEHMKERLQGLIVGPLSDGEYNKQWHKLVREAFSCNSLKFLLLDLEESIRGIAFSAGWTKPVDDWLISSSMDCGSCGAAASEKHGSPGGPKRRSPTFEFKYSSCDIFKSLKWWRGGKFSKIVFQKGALHSSLVKKAGRQGGLKRLSSIHYPEVFEHPRRSQRIAWRASVDMCKNASQLALQVRYLDAHLRWRDLVRPEENPTDGNGSAVHTITFRDAVICDKRIADKKISYAITFAIQTSLPLSVTKNILKTEKTKDMKDKFWFSENHVPLYLIKEYEVKVGAKAWLGMLRSSNLPRLKKKKLKCLEDILASLSKRRGSVRCHTCRGYYQKDLTVASPALNGDLELFTCAKCYRVRFTSLIGSNKHICFTDRK